MHFGSGINYSTVDLDPYVLHDHLTEIQTCHRVSRSIFFIVSSLNLLENLLNDKLNGFFLNLLSTVINWQQFRGISFANGNAQ